MLVEQYRMHHQIMQWSSDAMYSGKLVANQANSQHSVKDLLPQEMEDHTEIVNGNPLLLIDTAGALMYEGIDEESLHESKFNLGECDLVMSVIKELKAAGLLDKNIGVISPYKAQVNEIRRALRKEAEMADANPDAAVEVSTVDGF